MTTAAKCIGLIGGLGPGATVHYYKELLHAHAAAGLTPDLVMVNSEASQAPDFVGRNDVVGLARYLADLIARLKAAGGEIAVIPAVTPHICESVLEALSPLPLISMTTVAQSALAARNLQRVALFGTRFTAEHDMFGRLPGLEVVRPRADEIETIHGVYTEIVALGSETEAQAQTLSRIAHSMIDRDQIEAVVVAGTDFALILDEDRADYPIVDCARLHIEEIVRRAPRTSA